MKEVYLSKLRDKNSSTAAFRRAADDLALLQAYESTQWLNPVSYDIETPLSNCKGFHHTQDVVLIPILRAGLVFLPSFLKVYPSASVGVIGIRRDEKSAMPECYYCKLPSIESSAQVFILDPMIATGGSVRLALSILIKEGVKEEQITVIGVLAAPEGISSLYVHFPNVRAMISQIDDGLDVSKRIIPGLGDFGDRYFKTE